MEAINFKSSTSVSGPSFTKAEQVAKTAMEKIYQIKEAAGLAGVSKDETFSVVLCAIVQNFDVLTNTENSTSDPSVPPDKLLEASIVLSTMQHAADGIVTLTLDDIMNALNALKYSRLATSEMAQQVNGYRICASLSTNGIERYNSHPTTKQPVELSIEKKLFADDLFNFISDLTKPSPSSNNEVDRFKQLPNDMHGSIYSYLPLGDCNRLSRTSRDNYLTYSREVVLNSLMNDDGRKAYYATHNERFAKELFRDHVEFRLPLYKFSGDNGPEELRKLGFNFGPKTLQRIRNREVTVEEAQEEQQTDYQDLENQLMALQLDSGWIKYVVDGSCQKEDFNELHGWFDHPNSSFAIETKAVNALSDKKVQKYIDNGKLTIQQLFKLIRAEWLCYDTTRSDKSLFNRRLANSKRFVDALKWFEDPLDSGEVKMEDLLMLASDFLRLSGFIEIAARTVVQSQHTRKLAHRYCAWKYSE